MADMEMFSVLDAAGPLTDSQKKTMADRACDQCKARKVRCDMRKPCTGCISKDFECTYDKARKKRGPTGKRIAEIRRMQNKSTQDGNGIAHGAEALSDQPSVYSPSHHRTNTMSSIGTMESDDTQIPAEGPYWAPVSYATNTATGLEQTASSNTFFPAGGDTNGIAIAASPLESEFVFPSLPIDSPTGSYDAFGAIMQQDLPSLADIIDIWPPTINEETLLPWIVSTYIDQRSVMFKPYANHNSPGLGRILQATPPNHPDSEPREAISRYATPATPY